MPLGSATPISASQQLFANTTFHYADNVTVIRGRHMMKMGGQALREWINVFYSGNNGRSGYINFGGRFTAQNAINPAGTQIGEADFLLGLPDRYRPRTPDPVRGANAPSSTACISRMTGASPTI